MVPDALEWILRQYFEVTDCFHYLDDVFLAGLALSSACFRALLDMLLVCRAVGAPVKPKKVLGSATILTILGIELDTCSLQAHLPEEKLAALLQELDQFSRLHSSQCTCTKRQLLFLIGKLVFACKVIPAGCIFLRWRIQ